MKILIADALVASLETKLRNIGCIVHKDPSLKDIALQNILSDFAPDILVVRSTKVQKEHIQAS